MKKPMKAFMYLGLATLAVGTLVGCAPREDAAAGPTGTGTPGGEPVRIGIVFDSGGLGDKSFNDSAWRGIQLAEQELGVESVKVESKSEKDYQDNISALADRGLDLVIAVGYNMTTALEKVAVDHPNIRFAIVDAPSEQPNVRSLLFTEHEGSYLAGYLAGLMTQTGKVGFVGGQPLDLIRKFEAGYIAGVKAANPEAEVLPSKYTGSWDNVDKGKAAAMVLFGGGADIVYHAAGRAGLGVIDAAKETENFAIGVDSDQDDIAPGFVLTSMVKRVDQAVFGTIQDVVNGEFTPGGKVYDLKAGGVGLSEMRFTREKIGQEKLDRLDRVRQRIIDGEIQVPYRL